MVLLSWHCLSNHSFHLDTTGRVLARPTERSGEKRVTASVKQVLLPCISLLPRVEERPQVPPGECVEGRFDVGFARAHLLASLLRRE
jgi:hypothetical protein